MLVGMLVSMLARRLPACGDLPFRAHRPEFLGPTHTHGQLAPYTSPLGLIAAVEWRSYIVAYSATGAVP